MRIALLSNLKENAPARAGDSPDRWDDLDTPETIDAIISALKSGGHEAEFCEARIDGGFHLLEYLQAYRPDLCFNIAEGHYGVGREAHIPALLEMMRIPYTGSGLLTLVLALDKPMTKRILNYHDLPTPEFQVFAHANEEINDDLLDGEELRFPLFVKPGREGSGMGVSRQSIVTSVAELRVQVREMLATYNQPVLCERFIDGRELTVGLIGNLKPTAARRLNDRTAPTLLPTELTFFPAMEVNTDEYGESEGGVYTNRIKVELAHDFRWTCPANIGEPLHDHLRRLAAAVFRVIDCHDVARIDFRYDERSGIAWILEVNPLPGLNPEYSDLCIEARAGGWSYETLINRIVETAATRYGITQ